MMAANNMLAAAAAAAAAPEQSNQVSSAGAGAAAGGSSEQMSFSHLVQINSDASHHQQPPRNIFTNQLRMANAQEDSDLPTMVMVSTRLLLCSSPFSDLRLDPHTHKHASRHVPRWLSLSNPCD